MKEIIYPHLFGRELKVSKETGYFNKETELFLLSIFRKSFIDPEFVFYHALGFATAFSLLIFETKTGIFISNLLIPQSSKMNDYSILYLGIISGFSLTQNIFFISKAYDKVKIKDTMHTEEERCRRSLSEMNFLRKVGQMIGKFNAFYFSTQIAYLVVLTFGRGRKYSLHLIFWMTVAAIYRTIIYKKMETQTTELRQKEKKKAEQEEKEEKEMLKKHINRIATNPGYEFIKDKEYIVKERCMCAHSRHEMEKYPREGISYMYLEPGDRVIFLKQFTNFISFNEESNMGEYDLFIKVGDKSKYQYNIDYVESAKKIKEEE